MVIEIQSTTSGVGDKLGTTPPTIAFLRAEGVRGVRVFCVDRECGHFGVVSFGALAVPAETRFPDLVRVRRFTCTACGGSKVSLMPDWPPYRARG